MKDAESYLCIGHFRSENFAEMVAAVFDTLGTPAKPNVAFGFVFKNVEDGKYRYFMHMTTTQCWDDLNLWLLQKNCQKPRIY